MPLAISEYVPQVMRGEASARDGRAAWAAWAATLACAAGLVALIVLAPVLRVRGAALASYLIYQFFKVTCHQIPERSFHVGGYPFAVCARCFGLYAGALLGVAVYPLARPLARTWAPQRRWLLLAAVPTTVDFALGFTGLWENTHWSRFSTAVLLGVVAAFYVVPGLVDLFWQVGRWVSRRGRAGHSKDMNPNLRTSCG